MGFRSETRARATRLEGGDISARRPARYRRVSFPYTLTALTFECGRRVAGLLLAAVAASVYALAGSTERAGSFRTSSLTYRKWHAVANRSPVGVLELAY